MKRLLPISAVIIIIFMFAALGFAGDGKLQKTPRLKQEKDPNIMVWKCRAKPYMDQQNNTADYWMCTVDIKDKKLNYGLYWKPSKECTSQKVKDKYAELVEEREEFLEWAELHNEQLKVEMEYIKTQHFLIGWNIKILPCVRRTRVQYGLPQNPAQLNTLEALHIYAMRAEDCWDHHCRDFKMDRMSERDRVTVYWLKNDKQKETVLKNSPGYKGDVRVNRLVAATNPVIWERLHDDWRHDERIKFNHVHLIGMAVHDKWEHKKVPWPINWVTVGYGHRMEYLMFKDSIVRDFQETDVSDTMWGHEHWRYRIFEMIYKEHTIPSFTDIMTRNHETYKWIDLLFCFGYIDYMIFNDQEKWLKFQRAQRACKKTDEAMEKVFNWSPLMFEEMFKEWVLAYYPASREEDERWVYKPNKPRKFK
ncbi:hypothetical protein ACFL54_03665 [Planctomycetota bacterium]